MTFEACCRCLSAVKLSTCAKGAHTKQTILRNCGRSFLSLLELIAKIFCAVEVARTSAVLSNKLSFVAFTATPFEQWCTIFGTQYSILYVCKQEENKIPQTENSMQRRTTMKIFMSRINNQQRVNNAQIATDKNGKVVFVRMSLMSKAS